MASIRGEPAMIDTGFFEDVLRDLSGNGRIRLYVQPAAAIVLGIRLGIQDAQEGADAFLFRLFRTSVHPWALFRRSLSDAVVPLGVAVAVDVVLQILTLGHVRPFGALFVAALLVWLPFSMARGLTNRVWTRTHRTLPEPPGARG